MKLAVKTVPSHHAPTTSATFTMARASPGKKSVLRLVMATQSHITRMSVKSIRITIVVLIDVVLVRPER